MRSKTYIDTSVLISWILIEEEPDKIDRLPKKSKSCKQILDYIVNNHLNSSFITSDWAMSEVVRTFVDKAILKQFVLDGFTVSAFNRIKHEYDIDEEEIIIINETLNQFEKFLKNLGITFVETRIDWRKIHHYCLTQKIETPDAIHLHNAIQNKANYLTTIDSAFTRIKMDQIEVLNPSHLVSKTSIKMKK